MEEWKLGEQLPFSLILQNKKFFFNPYKILKKYFVSLIKDMPQICFVFVKIISKKNDNFDLALRKRLFCDAKPTLLPCKTAAFGTQNNRFYKALINKQLRSSYHCEKYLQPCSFLFAPQTQQNGGHFLPSDSTIQQTVVLPITIKCNLAALQHKGLRKPEIGQGRCRIKTKRRKEQNCFIMNLSQCGIYRTYL